MLNCAPDNWFVVQLKPNGLAIAQRHLSHQGFKSFSPFLTETISRTERRSNRSRSLFPGYLFVQFDPAVPGWRSINSTRGLSRLLLNNSHHPTPLPWEFMAALFARSDSQGILQPLDEIQVGDSVRVISGPFADLVTIVDQFTENDRICALVDLLGQKVSTSFPRSSVSRL